MNLLLFTRNDSLSQMKYARSRLARIIVELLRTQLNKAEERGKPNLNLIFLYNTPFCELAKTGGAIDLSMVEGILTIVKGKLSRGLTQTFSAYLQKCQREKVRIE